MATDFPGLVAAIVTTGKTKAQAISEAIKTHPALYEAYLKTGGKF